jgi:hypothetical protein
MYGKKMARLDIGSGWIDCGLWCCVVAAKQIDSFKRSHIGHG